MELAKNFDYFCTFRPYALLSCTFYEVSHLASLIMKDFDLSLKKFISANHDLTKFSRKLRLFHKDQEPSFSLVSLQLTTKYYLVHLG